MFFFLLLVVVPVVFCMVSWVLFSASQLFTVEEPHAIERMVAARKRSRRRPEAIPVSSGMIAEQHQRSVLVMSPMEVYRLRDARSTGIPNLWHDDIWLRRN